ncbi:MAG: hypothetical protein GWP91_18505 [Rhodobacterales bacterium]|nr:hypothetical protein [Rhodobacterales bacterium]
MVLGALIGLLFAISAAFAGPDTTRDSFDRLEEVLQLRVEDGRLAREDVMPAILVSAEPRYEASVDWYATRAVEVLQQAFGENGLRLCEACMAPRAYVENGYMAYQTGPVGLDEVSRLDDQSRGDAQAARSAIWLDEHRGGLSLRIIDLDTGRILFAQNIDPNLVEYTNSQRMYTLSEELERRARGDSVTQGFVDFAIYPGQHLSLDWTDQWGKYNRNLSGVSVSLFDPVLGIGAVHYRRIELGNALIGGKVLFSLPTALVRSFGDADFDLVDPPLTLVGVGRVPFGRSNYGAVVTVSTNGEIGIGISLMNISLLPVLL